MSYVFGVYKEDAIMNAVRLWIVGSVGCVVVGLMFNGMPADAGQPPAGKMAQMGLSGVQIVADHEALQVRGMGFSVAKVRGWAIVSGASPDGYHKTRQHFAFGVSGVASGGTFAGGFSIAIAR